MKYAMMLNQNFLQFSEYWWKVEVNNDSKNVQNIDPRIEFNFIIILTQNFLQFSEYWWKVEVNNDSENVQNTEKTSLFEE